jgi:hypothetical protein
MESVVEVLFLWGKNMSRYIRSQDEIKIFIDEMDNLILIQRTAGEDNKITINPANIENFMYIMELVCDDGYMGEENEVV